MPGIAGIISKQPYARIEKDLRAMLEAMRHETFYRGGHYVNRSAGLCVGWVCQEGSFADCMPLVTRQKDVVLIFQGENHLSEEMQSRLLDRRNGEGLDVSSAGYLL